MKLEYGPALREKEIAKLQARLEAAEAVCALADAFIHQLLTASNIEMGEALDNWRRVKEEG